MKESSRILTTLLLLTIFAGLGFLFGRRTARVGPESTIIETADTSSTVEAIDLEKPKLRDSTVIHHVWVKLPVVPDYPDSVPAAKISHPDSAQVEIPIERKVYQEDSLYRAVVSGYRVSLDSLTIYPTTTTITVYKTVQPREPGRWSWGVTAGPSMLVSPSGQVHAGLGISAGLTYRF
ncbi:MAG: hypothetical protein IJK48_09160 [Bacteroidales bacterium]|nr:hypothetical protein [Bacteroidales bacterium]